MDYIFNKTTSKENIALDLETFWGLVGSLPLSLIAPSNSKTAKFSSQSIRCTPGAHKALVAHAVDPLAFLMRHFSGDWGCVPSEDVKFNNEALKRGARLLSSYEIAPSVHMWVITDRGHAVTTVLLPSEY